MPALTASASCDEPSGNSIATQHLAERPPLVCCCHVMAVLERGVARRARSIAPLGGRVVRTWPGRGVGV